MYFFLAYQLIFTPATTVAAVQSDIPVVSSSSSSSCQSAATQVSLCKLTKGLLHQVGQNWKVRKCCALVFLALLSPQTRGQMSCWGCLCQTPAESPYLRRCADLSSLDRMAVNASCMPGRKQALLSWVWMCPVVTHRAVRSEMCTGCSLHRY